jgi:hypothetical protein
MTSIRTLIALATKHSYFIEQADVDSAYIQADLDPNEEVYVRFPKGLEHRPDYKGRVMKLKKALYGLKQSGRVWYNMLRTFLLGLGYKPTSTDACVYITSLLNGTLSYIAVYVDDLLFVGPSMVEIARVQSALQCRFGIKNLGPAEYILGIQIIRNESGSIGLSQRTYALDILDRFGLKDCRPLSTPMQPNLQLNKDEDAPMNPILRHRYLQLIGSLMYLMLGTRPDLCHAIGYLSRFSSNPNPFHMNAALHVLRYISGTISLGLLYNKSSPLSAFTAYSDSDWGADINTSRSTMGNVFLMSGAAICWASKLQSRIASSSTEAEYLGFNFAASEAISFIDRFIELGDPLPSPLIIFGDNQGAIALSKEPRFRSRAKHIRMSEHLARERVADNILGIEYIPTQDMVADIMTKALPTPNFVRNRNFLGLVILGD